MSDIDQEPSHHPPPRGMRPGGTPYRLDRYTANVIEEVRAETDNKIDYLNTRISSLETTLVKIVGMSEKTPDMFQNMSGLVQDLADQQKEIMKTMKMLATVVNQMMIDQEARNPTPGRRSLPSQSTSAATSSSSAIDDIQSAASTDLSLQSLSINDDSGPSTPSPLLQTTLGSGGKGKGKKGRKR